MTSLWCELTATPPPGLQETVAAFMREVAPTGLAIDEPVDLLGPEEGFARREGEPVALRAYVPGSELGGVLTQRLWERLAAFPEVELTARPLREEDWSVSWREFFGPVVVGRIAIVPTWVAYEPTPRELLVRLDPGQAFGTGHHESTRLCLAALEDAVRPGDRVVDVGAGSGILSIAAVKLGAAHVDAFELDPIAAEAAQANCAANGVAAQVTLHGAFPPTPETTEAMTETNTGAPVTPPADLAVANVSARADIALAGVLAASLTPAGRLIASGFLASDREAVIAAFATHRLQPANEREENDWTLLALRRDA